MDMRRVHPVIKIALPILIVLGIACVTVCIFVSDQTKPNIVRYSHPPSGIAIQFELPEGYGAIESPEGEGTFQLFYVIGEFAPESGPSVLRSSLSVADRIRIVPSYDPKIVTLEDWRATELVPDDVDVLEIQQLEIAGVTAEVLTFGGMGVVRVIQFVKDKNYYEIRTEMGLEDAAIAKIIDTFRFIE